jgi:hypothetical protein
LHWSKTGIDKLFDFCKSKGMKKVTEFCNGLDHPSKWANEHNVPPWLISRIRRGGVRGITAKYADRLIQASGGILRLEDFRATDENLIP